MVYHYNKTIVKCYESKLKTHSTAITMLKQISYNCSPYYTICCDIHTACASIKSRIFCSNEAGWNNDRSCQNVKNILVLASGFISLQTIYQTSAELKKNSTMHKWFPMNYMISLWWVSSQCKWLSACHTVDLGPTILHKTAYRCKTEWHWKQLFLW
jgi:hypothetical protein